MTATAAALDVRHFPGESYRAQQALRALEQGLPPKFAPREPWMLLWGPGAPNRFDPMREHLAAGGHVIALDLAYWQRDTKFRVSIDAAHPQRWVMRREWPAWRLRADQVPACGDLWNADGPILVAGLGPKARVQYGADVVDAWEQAMGEACRARWNRPVIYRKKEPTAVPIARALAGVSLVITWHSNVAVDAIRAGIPVICRDGAAAAVCPSELPLDDPRPLDPAVRDRFLQNLAWFQWAPIEARACWTFLLELLQ